MSDARPKKKMLVSTSELGRSIRAPRRDPGVRNMTPGQRWKLRRNLVIYIASQHGASQRLLADVFDLPHSRIAAIVKELRGRHDRPA